ARCARVGVGLVRTKLWTPDGQPKKCLLYIAQSRVQYRQTNSLCKLRSLGANKMKIFPIILRLFFVVLLLSQVQHSSARRFGRMEESQDVVLGKDKDRPRRPEKPPVGPDPREANPPP
ncbi:hypothetical protein Tsubulata_028038, partial [Turnera subulata]